MNRHHLLPKNVRVKGESQLTVKLCRDGKGCRVHRAFHQGSKVAAVLIRNVLTDAEVEWMVGCVTSKWVRTIYPTKLAKMDLQANSDIR